MKVTAKIGSHHPDSAEHRSYKRVKIDRKPLTAYEVHNLLRIDLQRHEPARRHCNRHLLWIDFVLEVPT